MLKTIEIKFLVKNPLFVNKDSIIDGVDNSDSKINRANF